MDEEIRTILVDDHKMFREGLKFILSEIKNLRVVGEASDGNEFLEMLNSHHADLVLMDISMPKVDGVEATEQALKINPKLKVIALSMFGDEDYYNKMINAGVKGFILKESGSHELEIAIRSVMNGEHYFSQKLLTEIIMNLNASTEKRVNLPDQVHITRREKEVLKLVCSGLSNHEIADRLHISVRTVEGHKTSLIDKTGVKNSTCLVIHALKNKLVDF